jgi:hypothetical protein
VPPSPSPFRSMLTRPSTQRLFFFTAGVVTSILYLIGAYTSRLNLSNVDGISYISIAKQYAAGLTSYAVNGYWSPLVSWLMAPLIAWGIDPVLAFAYVTALAGIVGTCAGMVFIWKISNNNFWSTLIYLIAAFSLYFSQIPTITPDTWVVTWTTLFAWTLIEVDRRLKPGTIRQQIVGGAAIGAMGVFGYLTKQYLIPVFIGTTVIWFAWRIISDWKANKPQPRASLPKRWLIAPLATILAAIIIGAPWVTALSIKYGEVTLGSSFTVNIGMKFDPGASDAVRDPLELPPPPNKYAVAFGEDRSAEVSNGGFTSSKPLFNRIKFYVGERLAVFPYYLNKIASFAAFAMIIIAAFLISLLFGWVDPKKHRDEISVLILSIVYFIGYAGITQVSSGGGNARYYWPMLTLSTIIFVLLLPSAWEAIKARLSGWRKVVAIILIALVPLSAFSQNFLGVPYLFSPIRASSGPGYVVGAPITQVPYKLAQQMVADNIIPAHSKLVGTNYRMTLRLAYYLESQAYGRSEHNYDISNPLFRDVLKKNDIDYFLRFTPVGTKTTDVSAYATVVKTYVSKLTCSDQKNSPVEACSVEVLTLK